MDTDEVDEEQDDLVVRREPKRDEVDMEAQSDFDREFARMLAETADVRRGERKTAAPIFDTAVPHIRRPGAPPAANGEVTGQDKMAFTLLSKRGNKQQVSQSWTYCPFLW